MKKIPEAPQGGQSFTLAGESAAAKQGAVTVGEPVLCLAGTEAKKSPLTNGTERLKLSVHHLNNNGNADCTCL